MTRITFVEDLSNESCNPMSSEELAPTPKLYQEYLRRWYFQERYARRNNVENNPSCPCPCPCPTSSSSSSPSLSSLFPYGDDVLIVPGKTSSSSQSKRDDFFRYAASYPDYTTSTATGTVVVVVTPKAA